MIQVICCSSLLSVPGRAGAFSRDFTTSLAPECRAFSGALKIEKLKALLIPGPEGAVDTNDWCITNLRKTTINNTNVDLVNDDEHTKFGLILSISSQEKPNSDINQGP